MDTIALGDRLVAEITGYRSVLVAFSGGVDSSLVLAAATRALGAGRVAAMTAISASLPAEERAAAERFCAGLGVPHHRPATGELRRAGYRENGPRRCYFCKSTVLDAAVELAGRQGYAVVATGTNAADLTAGFRPGIEAARERAVRSPLADLGMAKEAVRALARAWGLRTWDKPAAACLASRIAYGIEISPARLARVERAERAARALLARHQPRDLRVRDLGDEVRLEVDADLVGPARDDEALAAAIRAAGFDDLPVSVAAFRSGSLNDPLRAAG